MSSTATPWTLLELLINYFCLFLRGWESNPRPGAFIGTATLAIKPLGPCSPAKIPYGVGATSYAFTVEPRVRFPVGELSFLFKL